MSTVAEVRLWGRTIGAVSLAEGQSIATFEYAGDFVRSGIELAPIAMPLRQGIHTFPGLPKESFHGLPGLLADSLPDRFGTALINVWLAKEGRTPESFNAVERLRYIGQRGIGALEYYPTQGPKPRQARKIAIDALTELASEILREKHHFKASFAKHKEQALQDILRVGTSAGGARAKAIIAWNRQTEEIRSGQIDAGKGFEYWILKFDGVSENKDKELEDPKGYSAIEYAYSKMAKAAGIEMTECRLLEENGRRHFMTRRFDRLEGGEKLHMQSLAALAHYDFNAARSNSYEQALLVIRRLELGMEAIEQQFRRMTFNIMARNQDDHVKNIAFLMDKTGRWSLSPAYDITYSFNPEGRWTSLHQMSMNDKHDGFTLDDFRACAKRALMKRGRAEAIVEEVRQAVATWPEMAEEVGVFPEWRRQIQETLRLDLVS